jgi:regulator of cell morphogenesis and NO signaling
MQIHSGALVSEIATFAPGTIKVFQRHQLEFCCGGRIPLAEACAASGLDVDVVLAELEAATSTEVDPIDWSRQPLGTLVAYIVNRYHVPLREELPRLAAMADKVASRHGERLPHLRELRDVFHTLDLELHEHMTKEEAVLFPAVMSLETALDGNADSTAWRWIAQPIHLMEAEHESAGAALRRLRALSNDYQPPADACPTFRGLFHGLEQLERDMHRHVHLENHVLFPRAAALAQRPVTAAAR